MNIRSLTEADRDAWEHLYRGYAAYYKVETSSTKLDTLFSWLCDPEHVCEGLVADVSGQLVGLAHFRAMPSPLRGANVGFLDDLFVDPSAALAPKVVLEIFANINKIAKSGVTILVVEQNVRMALILAKYGYIIRDGIIMMEGEAKNLISDPAVKESFLGGSVANTSKKLTA